MRKHKVNLEVVGGMLEGEATVVINMSDKMMGLSPEDTLVAADMISMAAYRTLFLKALGDYLTIEKKIEKEKSDLIVNGFGMWLQKQHEEGGDKETVWRHNKEVRDAEG